MFDSYLWANSAPPRSFYVRIRDSSMAHIHENAASDMVTFEYDGDYTEGSTARLPSNPKVCGPICGVLRRKQDKDVIYLFFWRRLENETIKSVWSLVRHLFVFMNSGVFILTKYFVTVN